ncbi:MAG TPA: hypothetical protein VF480_01875 [Verrucomicrobiae bacterium]
MPVVKSSERTHQFVPEPFAFDVDPALALAVSIPAAMPTVAVVAEPHVAINFLTDLEFAGLEIDVLVALQILDLDALVALEILDLDVLFDVDVLIGLLELRGFIDGLALLLRLRIRRRRDRDSEPKRGKDGKNEGKFLQHFSASSRVLGRYLFPKPAVGLRASGVPEQALGLALSEE